MYIVILLLLALAVVLSVQHLRALITSDGLGYRHDCDLPRSTRHRVLEGWG